MTVWETINSPIIVTVVSFFLGGLLASVVAHGMQHRSQQHAVRVQFLHDWLRAYHEYMRYLRRDDMTDNQDEFDRVHAQMLSLAKIGHVIFGNEVGIRLVALTDKMQNSHSLRKSGRETKSKNERTEIYKKADEIIEQLYSVLR